MKTVRYFLSQYFPLGLARAPLLGLFCAASLWLSSQTTAGAQSLVQRDQQALTILSQAIEAGGGQQLITSIQDFTETGTIEYVGGDQSAVNASIKGRGLHQIRVDADLPEGRRSTVVNGATGSLTEANGQFRPIQHQSVRNLLGLTFPYLPLIAAVQDESTKIIYGGLVQHAGISAHDIRIEKVYTSQQDPTGRRGTQEGRDIYIDPKSLLVVSIFDQLHFVSNRGDGIPHEILYSNYHTESGIAMPMTISDTMRGVTGATMQLSQIVFNSGLTDADFTK